MQRPVAITLKVEEADPSLELTTTTFGLFAPAGSSNRDALVALYNSTGGANWLNNTNWLSNAPIGEWHGVITDDDGHVTELDLIENQLRGGIPSELGSLTNLESLWLSKKPVEWRYYRRSLATSPT